MGLTVEHSRRAQRAAGEHVRLRQYGDSVNILNHEAITGIRRIECKSKLTVGTVDGLVGREKSRLPGARIGKDPDGTRRRGVVRRYRNGVCLAGGGGDTQWTGRIIFG